MRWKDLLPSRKGLRDNLWSSLVVFVLMSIPAGLAWLADLPPLVKWLAMSLAFFVTAGFVISRELIPRTSEAPTPVKAVPGLSRYHLNALRKIHEDAKYVLDNFPATRDPKELTPWADELAKRAKEIRSEADRLGAALFPRINREADLLILRTTRWHEVPREKVLETAVDAWTGPQTVRCVRALVDACEDAIETKAGLPV